MDIIKFLTQLNKIIPPHKSTLIKSHSISLVKDNIIDVGLYPEKGGVYSIPVDIEEKTIEFVINEISKRYSECVLISLT